MELDEEFGRKLSAVFTELCSAGVALRNAGDAKQAIRCFEALALNDDSYEAGLYAFELALCHEDLGHIEDAKRFCAIAVRENIAVYGSDPNVVRILTKT